MMTTSTLEQYADPITKALLGYQTISGDTVEFDLGTASQMALTPEKGQPGRSLSEVRYMGKAAGTLCIIAFEPGDGTGDRSILKSVSTKDYAQFTKHYVEFGRGFHVKDPNAAIPRDKSSAIAEAHMAILGQKADGDPILYAGHLDVLGIDKHLIRRIGYAGLGHEFNRLVMDGHRSANLPLTTYTTNYRRTASGDVVRVKDPHAVVNSSEYTQVCGFLAIDAAHADCLDIFSALHTIDLHCNDLDGVSHPKFKTKK